MKQFITIKHYSKGLSIILDDQVTFEALKLEMAQKFSEAAHFFRDFKAVVSFEGRVLTQEEEQELVNIISENSQVKVLCIVGKDEDTDKQFVHALQEMEFQQILSDNHAQFYKKSLTNGKSIEVPNSIVIFGDVEEDCSVASNKDIIILGSLRGEALAGLDGDENHFVIAFDMAPEKLKIGGFKYRAKEKTKWTLKSKVKMPQIAYLQDGRVVMESVTKELLNSLN